jgi:hypothetical protein
MEVKPRNCGSLSIVSRKRTAARMLAAVNSYPPSKPVWT